MDIVTLYAAVIKVLIDVTTDTQYILII